MMMYLRNDPTEWHIIDTIDLHIVFSMETNTGVKICNFDF